MPSCEGRVSKEKKKLLHRAGQCTSAGQLRVCTDENDDESAIWLCKNCTSNFLKESDAWFGIFDDGYLPPNMLSEGEWLKRFC
jgi:hypothetical protein